jgi:hypothetical protein
VLLHCFLEEAVLLLYKLHGMSMASERDQQSNSACCLTGLLHVLLLQGEHVQQLLRGCEGQEGQLNLLEQRESATVAAAFGRVQRGQCFQL